MVQRDLSAGNGRAAGGLSWSHARLAAIGVVLIALTAAGPSLHLTYGGWMLLAIFAVGGAGAYVASRLGESGDERVALVIILAGAVLMRLALLFVEPYLSTDIYRYVWDGRVQAAGVNPYRYMPSAPELAQLRDTAIFPNINRADYAVTIYPPTAQAIFLAITRFGESVVAMKLGLLAFEAGTVAAIVALLRRQGAPATRVAIYAWHPLPDLGDRRQRPCGCGPLHAADGRPAAVLRRPHSACRGGGHARCAGQTDGLAGAARVLASLGLATAGRGGADGRSSPTCRICRSAGASSATCRDTWTRRG